MTKQKGIKRLSVILVVAMLLSMIPATLGFAAEANTAKVEAFVTRLYEAALDRQPDAGGLKYWTNQLATHKQTAAQAISFILIESREFQAKNLDDSAFLDTVYKAFFNRAADAAGKDFWTKKLTAGYSRRWVIQQMVGAMTGEFKRLCEAAGIVPGKVGGVTAIDVPYEIVSIAAIDKDQIEVKLNKAASADTVAVLKSGLVPYNTTNTWASDYKSVVLKNPYALPAGEYTVEVKGASAKVKVEAEKLASLKILSLGMQNIASSPVELELLNQYGKKMAVSGITITAFNTTKGTVVTATGTNLDLSGASIGDKIVVTAVHTSGLTASTTVTVIPQYAAGTFQLGSVVLPKDQTRVLPFVNSNTLYEIKYTLVNQYGQTMKLPAGTAGASATIGGIMFASTDPTVVNPADLTVDADGVLKFKALKEGTVTLTAVVVATGSSSTLTIKVDGPVTAKTFTIAAPASLVVAGEPVVVPYVAVDQFGNQIAQKDFDKALLTGDNTGISFGTSNSTVIAVNNFTMNNKNELILTAAGEGTATVYVYLKGVLQNSVTFTVVKAAVPTRITGLKNLPTMYEVGSSKAFTKDNVIVVDQYNRVMTTYAQAINVAAKDGAFDKVVFDGANFSAAASAGSEVIVFSINGVDNSAYEVTMGTVETKDITSYELSEAGTMYLNQTKTLTLTGKTASGQVVQLKPGKVEYTTSTSAAASLSNALVLTAGSAKGEATVAVWSGAKKLAEVKVTVSDVAPVATTVKFDADADYTLAVGSTLDMAALLTVKDQYGADFAKNGFWTTSDNTKVTVTSAGVIERIAAGEVTIGYVTRNGIAVTQVID